jgi:hypothetical protein
MSFAQSERARVSGKSALLVKTIRANEQMIALDFDRAGSRTSVLSQ